MKFGWPITKKPKPEPIDDTTTAGDWLERELTRLRELSKLGQMTPKDRKDLETLSAIEQAEQETGLRE